MTKKIRDELKEELKHTRAIQGNICCEGCYYIGFKQGKKEMLERELEFLRTFRREVSYFDVIEDRIKAIKQELKE
jgi:hypothetical protein